MGRARKKESSVVFIGEEEDKTPLLQKVAWSSTKKSKPIVSSSKRQSLICGGDNQSFMQYLFSENSVIIRILSSLCPPFGRFKRIAVDFEGSFLCSFLLTATVYWGLVNSKGESRLFALGHSSALTLGYLLGITAFTWLLSSCTNTVITLRQTISILGYGLFGHSITLLICEVGSDTWFMPLMTFIGGLSCLRILLILLARTPIPACRFVLCTPVAIIHLMYLIYLHFAIMKNQ